MKHIKITTYLLIVLTTNTVFGAVRLVPQEYSNIQAAIEACDNLDTVVVAPGIYYGQGNRNINMRGKSITVRGTDPGNSAVVDATIIDCEGKGCGFIFYMGENSSSMVAGLTITNGYAFLGGAIYCYNNSSPSITKCTFIKNSAIFGGAIACTNSRSYPNITNCDITENEALIGGGAIYCNGASPKIANCVISGNFAPDGGAIYSHNTGKPVIVNCTIGGNAASKSAGALYCFNSSNLNIENSILWGDTAPYAKEILVGNGGAVTTIQISYCDIQNRNESVVSKSGCIIEWGQGNIADDPNFANTGYVRSIKTRVGGDYHLLKGSSCIDAGNPSFVAGADETDIDGKPRISGPRIDIGAYEFETPITAIVKVTPETLNLASNGNWISCNIQLPADHDICEIDTSSITVNKEIKPAWSEIDEESQKLLIKFDRSEIQEMAKNSQGELSLTISGNLNNGMAFEGTDTIRIIGKGSKK